MLMFKTAVVLVVSSYLGIAAGQSRDQHNNISLNEGLELDFQGTELMVSQDRHSENSIRITRDFDLFIGDDKVQLTLAQKGLVGQFYDAASELDSIVDDLKINGLDFDADAPADFASDVAFRIQPVEWAIDVPEFTFSNDGGTLSLDVNLEGVQEMVAEMADEIKYIAETLAEELPRSDAFQEIREMIEYVGGLTDELKFISNNMRRHIPELSAIYRF